MRQLLQDVSSGEITIADVPPPQRSNASLLVATEFSLISAGTERAVLELGQSSLVGKARARPDLVRKVVESAREEGLSSTYRKVRGQLGAPNALGYSLAGRVIEACEDAPARPGELVACAGAGLASHAEVVSVPRTLCARVPEGVAAEDAAYSTVASIALHGVRLASCGLGDVVVVIGLGLVGQITMEILAASGCVPLGVDPQESRVELARSIGLFATTDAAELEAEARRLTSRRGADAVLICAASKSADPLALATSLARDRATVCIVGDVPIESPRAPLFAKELGLVVSRSYGPGRYDPSYEEHGIDYPAGYVRWTEGRNLEEVLRLMAAGSLNPSRLTTHTMDLEDGAAAYGLLGGDEPSLGILLRYGGGDTTAASIVLPRPARRLRGLKGSRARIGVIGAGAFARSVLMPTLARTSDITAVTCATGVSARAAAERFSVPFATTDPAELIGRDDVDAVVIATRHDSHAELVAQSLRAGKHVFVEKPLAIDEAGLALVEDALQDAPGILMVGFNRRFAPFSREIHERLGARGPVAVVQRINAGRLPRGHWTQDPAVGGGRIVGEGCHFVDLALYFAGAQPTSVHAVAASGTSEPLEDTVIATLGFENGSIATIAYSALGDPSLPKERIEVLGEHGAATIDDFRALHLHVGGNETTKQSQRDKGHRAELEAFLAACRDGRQPWPADDMLAVTRATFAIRDAVLGISAATPDD